MNSYAPVVVGTDGSSGANAALRWAAEEAILHRRPLRLVFVFSVSSEILPGMGYAVPTSSFVEEAKQILAAGSELARSIVHDTVPVTTALVYGSPGPALLTESKDAHMVVVGSHGHGVFSRAILGSVSSAVARHGHCPVAVIHEYGPIANERKGKPVLVGIDGTAASEPAIGTAMLEASLRGVPMQALLAWRDSSGGFFADSSPTAQPTDLEAAVTAQHAVLAESLAGWQEKFPEVKIERIVVPDNPVRNLLEHSRSAQLLVVGNRGRGGFAGLTLGSTSQALVHAADCPVIVVRHE